MSLKILSFLVPARADERMKIVYFRACIGMGERAACEFACYCGLVISFLQLLRASILVFNSLLRAQPINLSPRCAQNEG